MSIKTDHARFKDILRGKFRKSLRKFIQNGQMPSHRKDGKILIPVPSIIPPKFKYGDNKDQEGKGPGDGEEAGNEEGEKSIEVVADPEVVASLLGEELELPKIEPIGSKTIRSYDRRYITISKSGPNSLRHFKRTYKEALKRYISEDIYNFNNPIVIPNQDDFRYRAAKDVVKYEHSAVIIYMIDVSGSMGDIQKELARTLSFWINLWIKHNYDNTETRWIIHDYTAKEVTEEEFFTTKESGGTRISSAYELCAKMIEKDYSSDWNIYTYHISDGDSWGDSDNETSFKIMKEKILPYVNVFNYAEVLRWFSFNEGKHSDFYNQMRKVFNEEEVLMAHISKKEEIIDAIKIFLGKGK